MKKKVLLTSIATIALCLCLITGSTFALFTDSTNFNISVTAGDVEIKSSAEVVKRWSAEGPVAEHDDKYLKDENNNYYEHVDQGATFLNGGTADVNDEGTLVISKLTPGDKVDVKINTKNLSDVSFRFRYTISVVKEGGLETGMVLTTHSGEVYEAVKSFTSEWFDVVTPGTDAPSKQISLELPVFAGNEYQSEHKGNYDEKGDQYAADSLKTVEYQILVEAVQGNAVTTEDETYVVVYPTQSSVQGALSNNGTVDLDGLTAELEETLVAQNNDVTIRDAVIDATDAKPFGEPQLALYLANSNLTLEEGAKIVAGADFGVFGEGLNAVTLKKGSKIVVPTGSNAIALYLYNLDETFTLTFEEEGLIEGNTQIVLATAGTYNFYVSSYEAYVEYSAMIVTDGTAQNVNWMYLDGTSVN